MNFSTGVSKVVLRLRTKRMNPTIMRIAARFITDKNLTEGFLIFELLMISEQTYFEIT